MKNLLIIGVVSALICCNARSQKPGFTVRGKIENMSGETLMLITMAQPDKDPKQVKVDASGNFEFRDTVSNNKPALYILNAPGMQYVKHGASFGIPLRFIAQNGDLIEISGTRDEFSWASVKGNILDVQLTDLINQTKDAKIQENKIWDQIQVIRKTNMGITRKQIDSLENLTDPFMAKRKEILLDYIKQHSNDPIAAIALQEVSWQIGDMNELQSLYNSLGAHAKESGFAFIVETRLGLAKNEKKTEEGKPAPDFAKITMDGKPFKLSDYKGKYVLLDFWGSWCGPCRASHPHLKELNEKYKDDGLVVVGIAEERSLDKAAWLKAIHEDGLQWIQIMNDQGKEGMDVVSLYGIKAFPTKILIDKDGTVIMRYEGTNMAAAALATGDDALKRSTTSSAASNGSASSTKSSAESSSSASSSSGVATSQQKQNPAEKTTLDTKLQEIFNK